MQARSFIQDRLHARQPVRLKRSDCAHTAISSAGFTLIELLVVVSIIAEVLTEKIEVSEPAYTYGRGFEVSGIQLVYGMKGVDYKHLPQGRTK